MRRLWCLLTHPVVSIAYTDGTVRRVCPYCYKP